ncbi:hypothetical protein [Moorena sp. SIO1F2]|nr:hypothetical protein [Moorena sp. SIO1F2]
MELRKESGLATTFVEFYVALLGLGGKVFSLPRSLYSTTHYGV